LTGDALLAHKRQHIVDHVALSDGSILRVFIAILTLKFVFAVH